MARVAPLSSKTIPGTRSSRWLQARHRQRRTARRAAARRAMVRCRGCPAPAAREFRSRRTGDISAVATGDTTQGYFRATSINSRRVLGRKCARAGSATMGARVPSKSNASSTRPARQTAQGPGPILRREQRLHFGSLRRLEISVAAAAQKSLLAAQAEPRPSNIRPAQR